MVNHATLTDKVIGKGTHLALDNFLLTQRSCTVDSDECPVEEPSTGEAESFAGCAAVSESLLREDLCTIVKLHHGCSGRTPESCDTRTSDAHITRSRRGDSWKATRPIHIARTSHICHSEQHVSAQNDHNFVDPDFLGKLSQQGAKHKPCGID